MTLGQRIRAEREKRNISAPQLAKQIGITSQTIYQWEWDMAEPRISYAIWLADAFEMSLDELVGRTAPNK